MVQFICYIKKIIPRRSSSSSSAPSQTPNVTPPRPRNVVRSSSPGITAAIPRAPARYILVCFAVGTPFLVLPPQTPPVQPQQKVIQIPPNLAFVPPFVFGPPVVMDFVPGGGSFVDNQNDNPGDKPGDNHVGVPEPSSILSMLAFLVIWFFVLFKRNKINFSK